MDLVEVVSEETVPAVFSIGSRIPWIPLIPIHWIAIRALFGHSDRDPPSLAWNQWNLRNLGNW
jgi:hypothetical protein